MDERRHVVLSALALASILISSATPAFASGDAAIGAPASNAGGSTSRRTYIVRVRAPANFSSKSTRLDLESWYRTFLPPPASSEEAGGGRRSPLVHAYSAAMIGFAATLTEAEAAGVAARDGVLAVHPDRAATLLTTRTPDFLGLRAAPDAGGNGRRGGAWDWPGRMGEGTVIAVIDSNVHLKHASFRDDGMPAPPPRWRGRCEEPAAEGDVCNRKVIRVGHYSTELPRRPGEASREIGHGTHVASTAAGNFVPGASVLGSGGGTASGMAPRAHLAVYHVCGSTRCWDSDILAGMDAAIADGVDVISVSLHSGAEQFHDDPVAVAAFSAMSKGIFVSCAAGNGGPQPSTLVNEAPWILTVGASTIDRQMQAVVELGDDRTFVGESAYQPRSLAPTPLVYPTDENNLFQANCWSGMNGTLVAGKIVACENFLGNGYGAGNSVKEAGGVGVILLGPEDRGRTTAAAPHVIAASYVAHPDSASIKKYINSTATPAKPPVASIRFNGTALGTSPAPVVAYFSSRGPSKRSPGIVKPDIIGPGVDVIAAWPYKVGPSGELLEGVAGDEDEAATTSFNLESGTSMAAPHLSGIAALIKAAHLDWSPAMIKSAIMTTADVSGADGKPIPDEKLNAAWAFAMGAGHVNAAKAISPGLVYDIEESQYVAFLCGLGYTDKQVESITHKRDACRSTGKIAGVELNYPSIVVAAAAGGAITVNRTLTSVEETRARYTVDVGLPAGVKAEVLPPALEFGGVNDKRSFTAKLSWDAGKTKHAEGSLKWVSATHVVRIPIVIF